MVKSKKNHQQQNQSNNWRPNWVQEKEYLRFEKITPEQWAWEFLRRNEQYIQTWGQFKQTGTKPDTATLRQVFGITRLADPKTDWEHDGVWIPDENEKNRWHSLAFDMFPEMEVIDFRDKRACIEGRGMSPDEFARKTQPKSIEEVVVKFNLLNDIKSQLTAVELSLKARRSLVREMCVVTRSQKLQQFSIERCRNEFTQYLRLLDAEVQLNEKNDKELLKQVQPILSPTYDDDSFAVKDQIKRLKINLVRARIIRDGGYKSLTHVTHFKKLPKSADDFALEDSNTKKTKKEGRKKTERDPKTKRFASKQREK